MQDRQRRLRDLRECRSLGCYAHARANLVQRLLLDVGQDVVDPSAGLTAVETPVRIAGPPIGPAGRRQKAVLLLVGQAAEGQLLEVVAALHLSGCLARRLNGRQQQRDQNGDDRDDHQQLNQRKTRLVRCAIHVTASAMKRWKRIREGAQGFLPWLLRKLLR